MSLITRIRTWWRLRKWRLVLDTVNMPDVHGKYSLHIDVDGNSYRLFVNDVLVAEK